MNAGVFAGALLMVAGCMFITEAGNRQSLPALGVGAVLLAAGSIAVARWWGR